MSYAFSDRMGHLFHVNSQKESAAKPWDTRVTSGCFCHALLAGLPVKKPSGSA